MVDYLKNWMGLKKPEIHLNKNEPKFYFNEKLKRWVIEGEELETEKAKKPPPKKTINKDKKEDNKDKKKIKSKYASVFSEENIYTPEIKPAI